MVHCKESKCYRMRPGFKFPPLETGTSQSDDAPPLNSKVLLTETQRMIAEGEKFVAALRDFQEVWRDEHGREGVTRRRTFSKIIISKSMEKTPSGMPLLNGVGPIRRHKRGSNAAGRREHV